jgi:hypothetical protein
MAEESSMESLLEAVTGNFVWVLMAGCLVFCVLVSAVRQALETQARERSRREIAAYIAEGSISAEQGERLLRADINRGPPVP